MTTLGADEWAGMDLSVRRGNDHDPSWFSGLDTLEEHYDMIIVGAGISGCVFAERGSRELGLRSLIIDKRDHIGGNCYDFINTNSWCSFNEMEGTFFDVYYSKVCYNALYASNPSKRKRTLRKEF